MLSVKINNEEISNKKSIIMGQKMEYLKLIGNERDLYANIYDYLKENEILTNAEEYCSSDTSSISS